MRVASECKWHLATFHECTTCESCASRIKRTHNAGALGNNRFHFVIANAMAPPSFGEKAKQSTDFRASPALVITLDLPYQNIRHTCTRK